MFCKNCGNQMIDGAAVCVKCGVAAGRGNTYCPTCGAENSPNAAFCLKCGVALNNVAPGVVQKSKLTAGLLGVFLGGLGVHSFYLGYTGKGVAQILLSFCFGAGYIWGLIEGILILTGSINKDANGVPLAD